MGHAHIQTTARYLHHRAQRNDAALLAEAFRATTARLPAPGGARRESTQLGLRVPRNALNAAKYADAAVATSPKDA